MTLTFCTDVTPADWLTESPRPWNDLVSLGPSGFESYARLRFLPDPTHPGQSENDVDAEDWRDQQLPRLLELLTAKTPDADDCFFCVWEGFGTPTVPTDEPFLSAGELAAFQRDAHPGLAPTDRPSVTVPQVVVPHRAFYLFRGPLTEVGTWDAAEGWPAEYALDDAEPAFIWPASRTWCYTHDVDPHWATIAGPTDLIADLTATPGLDMVPTNPTGPQSWYH